MNYNNILTGFNNLYSWGHRKFFPKSSFSPRQFIFEITYRCNFSCSICQFHPILKRKDEPGSTELKADQIIECIKKLPSFSLISFTGGEPLVREDFADIIKESAKIRRIHIITNGSLLEPGLCEILCKNSIDHLFSKGLVGVDISYYGGLEGGKIISNPSTKGLENILEAKIASGKKFPFINFKIVITEKNIPLIIPFYEYATEKGVDVCSYLLKTSSSNFDRENMLDNISEVEKMLEAPPLDLKEEEKKILKEQLYGVIELSKKRETQLRFSPSIPVGHFYDLLTGSVEYNDLCCYAPWTFAAISAYGDLFPCSNLNLGSLLDQSLTELWQSEKMKQFRLLIKKGLLPNCKKCCYLQKK